jgi:c-di-GMP-binding flagellar brake protein YcgR
MNIRPGTELTIIIDGTGASFKSFLVGEKKESQIVVGLPGKPDFPLEAFQKGSSVLVQYSDDENIYEFRTRILKTLQDPADLIVLEYPDGITTIEKRSRRRINCLMEAKFEIIFEDNNRLVTGIIENISKTGCSCVLTKTGNAELLLSLGDVINIRCQFPGLSGEQTAEGTIIRLQELQDEVYAGIRFDKELWWVPPYDPERKND